VKSWEGFACDTRAHDDNIIIVTEEHVTSYSTHGESRIFHLHYK